MGTPLSNNAHSPRSTRLGRDTSSAQKYPFSTMPGFDILDWHPAYQSCQKYFLDHAQHEAATQALCALINIRLPSQWRANPVFSSQTISNPDAPSSASMKDRTRAVPGQLGRDGTVDVPTFVSLIPYIRRLIVTGFDTDGILHGFFGDAWQVGITPLRECERRNYLYAAKSGGWHGCKDQYDIGVDESVPFMQPLQGVTPEELDAAGNAWNGWLAVEDAVDGRRASAMSAVQNPPSDSYSYGNESAVDGFGRRRPL